MPICVTRNLPWCGGTFSVSTPVLSALSQEGDAEFEAWKSELVKTCPWYKQMQQKFEAGTLDEGFPFLGLLSSGAGDIFSADIDMDSSKSGFDMR